MREKVRRAGADDSLLAGFSNLLELNSIPDLQPAVANGELEFETIWELRNSEDASQFRQWLREAAPADARELERAYVAAISKEPLSATWPARAIRMVVTTAAGLIPGIGGLIGGASAEVIDSFFIEKWLDGYSPKLFIDELQDLEPEAGNGDE